MTKVFEANYHIVMLIHIANTVDALLTLVALSHGVEEANPVMLYVIEYGLMEFLILKFGVIAVSTEILHFYLKGSSRIILNFLLVVLLSVVGWHTYGLLNI